LSGSADSTLVRRAAYVRLGTACNAKCRMCDFWRSTAVEMSAAMVSRVLGKLAALGYSEVIFTGGEPLLSGRFDVAVSIGRRHGLQTSVITNGALLPDLVSSHGALDDIHRFYISIDSPISKTHDAIRGIACLDTVERALARGISGAKVVANTVLSRLNREDVLLLPEWLGRHDVPMIDLIFMKHPRFALGKREALDVARELLWRCHALGVRHHVTSLPGGASCELAVECLDSAWPADCSVADVCLFVDHDGNSFPCNCSSYAGQDACLGNLLEGALDEAARTAKGRSASSKGGCVFGFCRDRCDLCNRLLNYMLSKPNGTAP
jgi:MoaA/NifB/PqqE/SkfB family radical SAM enzyme